MSMIEQYDLDLRCFNCKRFAYNDLYKGDYGTCGYLCRSCIEMMAGKFRHGVK